jgi:NAD(P)-dependent dehydrogenase (short-subunit alcohol dehydrogenase family)
MNTAVVTGGSRGLGLELARGLAASGWTVVIDGRDAAAVDAAAKELRDAGAVVLTVAGDVADEDHRNELIRVAREAGPLTVLVNNASALGPSPLPTLTTHPIDGEDGLLSLFAVNVVAPLRLVQLAAQDLRATHGVVVNVVSDAGRDAYETWGGYGATKAALDHASRVLAAEEPDVRVYSVDPGDLRTAMHQAAFPGEDISDRPLPETAVPGLLTLIRERPPSGRYRVREGRPERVEP